MIDREAVVEHIKEMKERQEKVKSLIEKNKTLEEVKSEFNENETRLIETICNEIKKIDSRW